MSPPQTVEVPGQLRTLLRAVDDAIEGGWLSRLDAALPPGDFDYDDVVVELDLEVPPPLHLDSHGSLVGPGFVAHPDLSVVYAPRAAFTRADRQRLLEAGYVAEGVGPRWRLSLDRGGLQRAHRDGTLVGFRCELTGSVSTEAQTWVRPLPSLP